MVSMSKAKIENRPLPKRFYTSAAYEVIEDGYVITLDGKRVRTPQQKLLQCSSQQLAAAIAAEWQAQGEQIDTDSMPLTRLLNIALDRVEQDRDALLADITNYAQTDLLCYRAPLVPCSPLEGEPNFHLGNLVGGIYAVTTPPTELLKEQFDSPSGGELRKRQAQHFNPILAWADEAYGLTFLCTDGLVPIAQPQASINKIAALFTAANSHELAALSLITPILGSALLALALWKGRLNADEALSAAHLDETVHATTWGEDPEVVAKWAAKCRDVNAAALFLASCAH